MNKLYVIRLREVQHPIVISVREDTFKLWIDSVRKQQISGSSYTFNWQDGTYLEANLCNLMGKFIVRDAGIEVNLYVSCYRSTYCSLDEFMGLFRIGGKHGWCISSVVNVS